MISNNLEFELYISRLKNNIKILQKHAIEKKRDPTLSFDIQRIYFHLKKIEKLVLFHLTAWQHVEISRNFSRPSSRDYINFLFNDFQELSGDRICSDDRAIVGGIAMLGKNTVMVIGQQKGTSIRERSQTLFGMTSPSGFRKSMRMMKIAERFDLPIVTFIDTPGADPGISAEKNNQSCAIAYSLLKMPKLRVPIISIVIGEGCSGGALAVSTGDVVLMLQYSYYSILAPEGCSLILRGEKDSKEYFTDILCLTSEHVYSYGLIHDVISESHEWTRDSVLTCKLLREKLKEYLDFLSKINRATLINKRFNYWKSG